MLSSFDKKQERKIKIDWIRSIFVDQVNEKENQNHNYEMRKSGNIRKMIMKIIC